jgi:DNA-binding NtrC family response regulator
MIQYALKANGGRLEETAVMLGISRKGLYPKHQRYGLDSPFDEIAAEVA